MVDNYKCKTGYGCSNCHAIYPDLIDAEECCNDEHPRRFIDLYGDADGNY